MQPYERSEALSLIRDLSYVGTLDLRGLPRTKIGDVSRTLAKDTEVKARAIAFLTRLMEPQDAAV